MKLIIDIDEEWYSNIIASKDAIDEDDEAYLILNGVPYEERLQGDLISRSALKKSIKSYADDQYAENEYLGEYAIMDIIDNAPAVYDNPYSDGREDGYIEGYEEAKRESKRPQGEWIMQRHDLDGCFYTCSNCGRMIRVSPFIDDPEDNETLEDYPFCHCGADMRKGNAE